MATGKKQRYGILVILIVMVVGTIGSFAVMILSSKTDQESSAKYQQALSEYTKIMQDHQAKIDAQGDELSKQYYDDFNAYRDSAEKFALDSVTSLSTKDLVDGKGKKIDGKTKFAAYYIGWDANGRIFDQSIDTASNKLKAPLPIETGLDEASLIEGWKVGMKGMRIGGVRLITIPSEQAYGEQGSGDIAPNMPLKFIVMAIEKPADIPQPDTTELIKVLQENQ